MSSTPPDSSEERAFHTLWETLHLGKTLRPDLSVYETIVPSEDQSRRLDFSLVTLPNLTGADTASSMHVQLELGRTIGKGGMAIVHLARQLALHRDVAVKTLRAELRTPETTRVLLSEAWVTGILQHPNIVPVYALGRDDSGSPLLVMKCITGTAWRELIRNPGPHAAIFGKLTPLEWHLGTLIQVCNAVGYAHSKGIIHRDLKPENVMIGEFGEVYLLDWGLAVSLDDTTGRFRSARSIDAIAGTPGYMAPEMVDWSRHQVSERTDIYLLGAILHEIITGTPRHTGKTLFEVIFSAYRSEPARFGPDIPAELGEIVNRATHADPAQRYASADQLKQALLEFLRHRESAELAREASARLSKLKECVETGSAVEIYRSFGEARFGYEQALRAWSGNDRAQHGLQAALRVMAEYELERGSPEAAAALISELTEDAMPLRARLEGVRQKRAREQARVERLEQLEKDHDIDFAARARASFVVFLAIAWTILPFTIGYVTRHQIINLTWSLYIGQTATFGAIMLGGFFVWRRAMMSNEVNRKVMAAALFIYIAVLVHRVLAYLMNIPIMGSIAQELHLYFLGLGLLAIGVDRRLIWGSFAYLLAAFGDAFFPVLAFEWHGIGNGTALTLIAFVWKQGRAKE